MTPLTLIRRRLAHTGALALAVATLLLSAADAPRPAHAAGMVVNTLADANPPLTDGQCSLREAITNANANAATWPDCPAGAGADTITFSVSGTIVLVAGLPDITDGEGLVVDGGGQSLVVSGNDAVRPFSVAANGVLSVQMLEITLGRDPSFESGGGIRNHGKLVVSRSKVTRSSAQHGGGIYNGGTAQIAESTLIDNTARGGGAVYNGGSLEVVSSDLSRNEASGASGAGGGGIYQRQGTLDLVDTRIDRNYSGCYGGGVHATGGLVSISGGSVGGNFESGCGAGGIYLRAGVLNLNGVAIRGNVSEGPGGGISVDGGRLVAARTLIAGNAALGGGGIITGGLAGGDTTLDNVDVSDNVVSYGGGGIYHLGGLLTIRNSAIHRNASKGGGGLGSERGLLTATNVTISNNYSSGDGGGLHTNHGEALLTHVTVAGNAAAGTGGGLMLPATTTISAAGLVLAKNKANANPDCQGPLTLTGPNLIGDTTGCAISGTPPIVADPLLAPLADNGGPTWTHALLPGSPALGVGDPAVCAAAPVSGRDQRGVARPQGAGCDLGAYEATAVGGKHLRVGASPGQVKLGWDSGYSQTGYTLLKYNTATASATLIPLAANAVAYTDSTVTNGVVYCYVVAATGPSSVLGLSDLVCALPGSQSGAVLPQGFTLSLHGTANASLSWEAPAGGVDSYLLVRIPLDGSAVTNVPLPGSATASVQPVPAAGACFQLVAFKGAAYGTTEVLCGVPGVSTLSGVTTEAALVGVVGRIAGVSGGLSSVVGVVEGSGLTLP